MIESILEFMETGIDVQYLIDEWKMSEDVTEGILKIEGTKQTFLAYASQEITFRGIRKISIIELMNLGIRKNLITLTINDKNVIELRSGEVLFFEGVPVDVNSKAYVRSRY